jgi:iron complex transport system permease protein
MEWEPAPQEVSHGREWRFGCQDHVVKRIIMAGPAPRHTSLVVLAAALLLSATLALMIGSVHVAPAEVVHRCWNAIHGTSTWDAADRILFEARLPRILLAAAAGIVLSLAGLTTQTLFLNALASPYVIGVSSGSALGAVIAILLAGPLSWGFGLVPVSSAACGMAITVTLFIMARGGRHLSQTLLLAGIAIGSLCAALTAGALYLAEERLQTLVFWMMGGFWRASWRDVAILLPVAAISWTLIRWLSPAMDVLLLGQRAAHDLGVNVPRTVQLLLVLVGATTAVAVSLCGVIGFVDLIVPHLLRPIVGAGHRRLGPACALAGGTIMILADVVARTLASPAEIPVGIVTAILGSPVFLWLLLRRSAQGGQP